MAFQNIKNNASAASKGMDGKTWVDYQKLPAKKLIQRIRNRFTEFRPMPVRRIFIRKENGEKRQLGILTIEDRIIQQCIKQVIEPICEAKFHPNSYGFRPLRATMHAISKLMVLSQALEYPYCVVIDIKDFFDNINHDVLSKQIMAMGLRDKRVNSILAKMMKPEIEGEGIPKKGVVQGGNLSPLLSNIALNDLDWWVNSQCRTGTSKPLLGSRIYMIRYADDFKILCKEYSDACCVFRLVKLWLKENLYLPVAEAKSGIVDLRRESMDFLGFEIMLERDADGVYYMVSDVARKSRERMLRMLHGMISRGTSNSMEMVIREMNKKITGMHRYYRIAMNVENTFQDLETRLAPVMEEKLRGISQRVDFRESGLHYMEEMQVQNRNYMTYKVGETVLVPISCIAHRRPELFPYDRNIYTKEGRQGIAPQKFMLNGKKKGKWKERKEKDVGVVKKKYQWKNLMEHMRKIFSGD